MRQIKFRGLGYNNHCWYYGDLKHTRDLDGTRQVWIEGNLALPASVGEHTGQTDRHGRDIYEGDIVRHCITGESGVVRYSQAASGFLWNDKFLYDFYCERYLEVTGNDSEAGDKGNG